MIKQILSRLAVSSSKACDSMKLLSSITPDLETSATIAAWWKALSPTAKKKYIKDYPNSKYAKEAEKLKNVKPAAKGGKRAGFNLQTDKKAAKKAPTKTAAPVKDYKPLGKSIPSLKDGKLSAEDHRQIKSLRNLLEGRKQTPQVLKDIKEMDALVKADKEAKAVEKQTPGTMRSDMLLKRSRSANKNGDLERGADYLEKYLKAKKAENPKDAKKWDDKLAEMRKNDWHGRSSDHLAD